MLNMLLSVIFFSPRTVYIYLFTTWARFPLFSQGIKFTISRSKKLVAALIVTGEDGAETIADNNS